MKIAAWPIAALIVLALEQHDAHRAQEHAGHERADSAETRKPEQPSRAVPGYANVELAVDRMQLFGVRTTLAKRQALTKTVRTVGIVRTDETRESHVHVKWEAWIEEYFTSYIGQEVRKGDPLISVYSPDLVNAQQEFLIALRRSKQSTDTLAADVLSAARTRLKLWDVPDDVIAEIERTEQIQRAVTIRAPRDGTVIAKMAIPGMFIEPEMELYTIADLSRVWILADIYEYELPFIKTELQARFTPVGGTETFEAQVAFISPVVNPATRTVKARLELSNDERKLRPGAYGTATFDIPLPEAIIIPSDSVIDTGVRQIAFVKTSEGMFEPRQVRTGARAADQIIVLEGIREGEEVVVRAQFMLDSESRLRSAAAVGGKPGHTGH
ncbi:MAG: efflux RND transporter periplasmic adaptor subunit [Planctomycetes bacterium]|nr:efflux RND transporter periplasmic adaptor subunit [Planctomycetota bacterium]NUQ33876.1 efflux RND transporter periplasmic adaptor subunit [Planctomycetaceae bacterium]